jgi:hypothetical protein
MEKGKRGMENCFGSDEVLIYLVNLYYGRQNKISRSGKNRILI